MPLEISQVIHKYDKSGNFEGFSNYFNHYLSIIRKII